MAAAACYQTPRLDPSQLPEHPAGFPFAKYRQLAQSGQRLYGVDTRQSWVHIKVYRGGKLARLGHNHIVSTHLIHGLVALGPRSANADLYISLADLLVDLPALRVQAGDHFATRPSTADIAATRANMLGERVLDTARTPFAELSLDLAEGLVSTGLKIRGVKVPLSIPLHLPLPSPVVPPISGVFHLNLSDFGIEAFTALAGALRVVDEVEVEYQLQLRAASRVEDAFASKQYP